MATPLNAPETHVWHNISRFLVHDLTADSGSGRFRRVRAPLYILGEPYRLYLSASYLSSSYRHSGATLNLVPRPKLSSYNRYAILTETSTMPDFDSSWSRSPSPVIDVDSYSGSRYLHLVLPHGTAPEPTLTAWAEDGSAAIAMSAVAGLEMIDGITHRRYTSDAAIDQPAGITRLVVLPERDGIGYWDPPYEFADADLGFTWYAGFFHIASGFAPVNPVDAALLGASETASSTTETVTLPSDSDGGQYDPEDGTFVAYIAQPEAAESRSPAFIPCPRFPTATFPTCRIGPHPSSPPTGSSSR